MCLVLSSRASMKCRTLPAADMAFRLMARIRSKAASKGKHTSTNQIPCSEISSVAFEPVDSKDLSVTLNNDSTSLLLL